MKLIYWVSRCKYDSEVYNIRRRTRKEVQEALDDMEPDLRSGYGNPFKFEVEYANAFDLLCMCKDEDGVYEHDASEEKE
jgi:hypothetical protein